MFTKWHNFRKLLQAKIQHESKIEDSLRFFPDYFFQNSFMRQLRKNRAIQTQMIPEDCHTDNWLPIYNHRGSVWALILSRDACVRTYMRMSVCACACACARAQSSSSAIVNRRVNDSRSRATSTVTVNVFHRVFLIFFFFDYKWRN